MRRKIRSRAGAVRVILAALRPHGCATGVIDIEDEPVCSIEVKNGKWVDVFVRFDDG